MAIFQGLGGKNTSQDNQNQGRKIRAKSVLRYTMMPEILPRIRAIGFHFGHFAYLLALIFSSARLIPQNHPAVSAANIGRFGVRQVIAIAANNITWSRKHIDQIAIFSAIVLGLVMIIIQAALIAFAALVGFNPAEASSLPSFFEPGGNYDASNDPVMWFLAQVFGDLDGFWGASFINNDYVFGTSTRIHDGIYAMLSFYSLAMMVIAVIIVIYYIMTVVGEAAKTGTPFGQRFNSLWAPIRLVIALGLLVPLASGLNSAQYLTLWIAKMGSGMGTNMWNLMLPNFASNSAENYLIGEFENEWVSDMAIEVFFMEVCRFSENKYNDRPFNGDASVGPKVKRNDETSYWIEYTTANTWRWNSANCGDISINVNNVTDSLFLQQEGISTEEAFKLSKKITEELVFGDSNNLFSGNRSPIAELARQYVEANISIGGYAEPIDDLDTILRNVLEYAQGVKDNAFSEPIKEDVENSFDEEFSKLVSSSSDSWIYSGVLYLEISRIIQDAKDIELNVVPNYNRVLRSKNMLLSWDENDAAVAVSDDSFTRLSGDTEELLTSTYLYYANRYSEIVETGYSDNIEECRGIGVDANEEQWYLRWGCAIAALIIPDELTVLANPSEYGATLNPMGALVDAGYSIFNKAFMFVGHGLLGTLGGGAISAFGSVGAVIGGVLSSIGSLAILAGTLGLAAGFVLAFLLPVMPFIYFFFAVVAWVMEIFEAVIAMPLWALAHLRIEGDGLPGQAAAGGYYLLLAILLRPALIVIGLIAGAIIFGASVFMLQYLFQNVIFVSTSGSASGLEVLMYTLIFTYICYTAAITSFKLVDKIPDQILRWIGAGVTTFSDGHDVDLGGQTQMLGAAAGFIAGGATNSMASGLGTAGQAMGKEAKLRSGYMSKEERTADRDAKRQGVMNARLQGATRDQVETMYGKEGAEFFDKL